MKNLITKLKDGYTLKMFSDVIGKRHDNLKRDFNNMIDSLSEAEVSLLKFEESKFSVKTGKNTIKEIKRGYKWN